MEAQREGLRTSSARMEAVIFVATVAELVDALARDVSTMKPIALQQCKGCIVIGPVDKGNNGEDPFLAALKWPPGSSPRAYRDIPGSSPGGRQP